MIPRPSQMIKISYRVIMFAALSGSPLVMSSPLPEATQLTAIKHTLGSAFQGKNQKSLTNADVMDMLKAGLPESTIILAIQKDSSNLDTSAQALIQLKRQGATQKILDAMLKAESISGGTEQNPNHSTNRNHVPTEISLGVILIDGSQRVQLKMSTPSARVSTGGMMRVVNPLKKLRVRNTLNGNRSQTRTPNVSPIFEVALASNLNPTDNIVLVRLTPKSDRRELDVARSTLVGGVTTEIREKDKVPIILEESSTKGSVKIYRIKVSTPLSPGEYAVLYSSAFYDFGIDSN